MRVVAGVMCVAVVGAALLLGYRVSSQVEPALFGPPSLMHTALESSTDASLRALAPYEQRAGRGVDSAMVFRDMPKNAGEARVQAAELAAVLAAYDRHAVPPLVVFEPQGLDLGRVDMSVFEVYFDALKAHGVTDDTIGTWIPFPEPNIPEWHGGNTDPKLFVSNMTAIAQIMRTRFHGVRLAVLLDSKTYPSGDMYWAHGTYDQRQLLRYVTGFPPGLIDVAGLQGLTWEPEAGVQGQKVYDASDFLPAKSAIAMAKKLEVQRVLLNTGTHASMHDYKANGGVMTTPAQREQSLHTILQQAVAVQRAGMLTTINLFAEDKQHAEADWSYGQSSESWGVLVRFVTAVSQKGLGLSLFVGAE